VKFDTGVMLHQLLLRITNTIWYKQNPSFIIKIFQWLLWPLSLFYQIGFYIVSLYKQYFQQPYRAHCPVIAVGNLSVGGTGKSVFVSFLVNLLQKQQISKQRESSHLFYQ